MIDRLNENAWHRLRAMDDRAEHLRIEIHNKRDNGQIYDFGVNVRGGLEAGIELAHVCLGDAGTVSLTPNQGPGAALVQVFTDQPGLACMGSQYGGWPVKTDDYFAIGSGPIRLRRGKEDVLEKYGWLDQQASQVVCVLESGKLPSEIEIELIASECDLAVENVIVCVAPTKSMAGTLQIVARSVEATMHKLYELDIDLKKVTSAFGTAPLPPVSGNDLVGIGRTNDAILYSGIVTLWVDMPDEQIMEFGPSVPSNSSSEFGKPFAEIFESSGGDFYKLDPMLFSAAHVTVVSNISGHRFSFGETKPEIVRKSFGFV